MYLSTRCRVSIEYFSFRPSENGLEPIHVQKPTHSCAQTKNNETRTEQKQHHKHTLLLSLILSTCIYLHVAELVLNIFPSGPVRMGWNQYMFKKQNTRVHRQK
jgi:hypothetical protein